MISPLGQKVVREISHRMNVDEKVVMRAFLTVGLLHQHEIMRTIGMLKYTEEIDTPYILEAHVVDEIG